MQALWRRQAANPWARIVANAITLETLGRFFGLHEELRIPGHGADPTMAKVETVGAYHMPKSTEPAYDR